MSMSTVNAAESASTPQQHPEYLVRSQWPLPEKQEIPESVHYVRVRSWSLDEQRSHFPGML